MSPSVRRAAKSWICADTARCSGHIPPASTGRKYHSLRCPNLTSRMSRHFTISFCIFSANARALRVCQAAHSPAFQVMEFGGLVNKWHHSDTARTATLPSLAKRRLQCDKPSTHLSTDMIYPQQTTHLPKQRNVELPKEMMQNQTRGNCTSSVVGPRSRSQVCVRASKQPITPPSGQVMLLRADVYTRHCSVIYPTLRKPLVNVIYGKAT